MSRESSGARRRASSAHVGVRNRVCDSVCHGLFVSTLYYTVESNRGSAGRVPAPSPPLARTTPSGSGRSGSAGMRAHWCRTSRHTRTKIPYQHSRWRSVHRYAHSQRLAVSHTDNTRESTWRRLQEYQTNSLTVNTTSVRYVHTPYESFLRLPLPTLLLCSFRHCPSVAIHAVRYNQNHCCSSWIAQKLLRCPKVGTWRRLRKRYVALFTDELCLVLLERWCPY